MQAKSVLITSRDPKGMQAVSIFEAAYNKSKLNDSRAQLLNERGGELKEGIMKLISELIVSNRFANEEVFSDYTYPNEYNGPRPIVDQILILSEIMNLDPKEALEYAKQLPSLPVKAEGWFAIVSNAGLKKLFPQITEETERYCVGVRFIFDKIAASRKFFNYRDGQILSNQLRVNSETVSALDQIASKQSGDILIVAGQLGMLHKGRSVRRARDCFEGNEFGLGLIAVSSILLTHPNRLACREELGIYCLGDDFNDFNDADSFIRSPTVDFYNDEVEVDAIYSNYPLEDYGSASAFIPK